MNGVDFPVSRVLDGIAAAREAGLAPIKINTVVRRGHERGVDPAARPLGTRRGPDPAVHRVHGRRAIRTAGGSTTSCPAEEILATIDAELPLEPVAANYRGEVAGRYRFRDGDGESA